MSDKAVHEEVVQLLKDYTDKGHDKENALQLVRSVIFLYIYYHNCRQYIWFFFDIVIKSAAQYLELRPGTDPVRD